MTPATQAAGLYPEPPAAWVAWRKKDGGRWKPVVSAPTYDEAFRLLLNAMTEPGDWSNVVLREGEKP